jgi:hypothetical protein
MSFANFDYENAGRELLQAALPELPKVDALRRQLRELAVQELGYRQCLAVAPVATDGGENRLYFDPMNVEIVRVADSEGREHFQKFIPLSAEPALLERMFRDVPLLKTFLERIGMSYRNLSYFLPGNKRTVDPDERQLGSADEDLRRFVRSFRDIAEWAVLLDLAAPPWHQAVVDPRRTPSFEVDVDSCHGGARASVRMRFSADRRHARRGRKALPGSVLPFPRADAARHASEAVSLLRRGPRKAWNASVTTSHAHGCGATPSARCIWSNSPKAWIRPCFPSTFPTG